ncbi:hypothetical protein GYH30_031167 [Glycine max]|nr:hypothetical protein GYH30_031167 [Glycine max]
MLIVFYFFTPSFSLFPLHPFPFVSASLPLLALQIAFTLSTLPAKALLTRGRIDNHKDDNNERKNDALLVMADVGRSLESIFMNLVRMIKDDNISVSLEWEKSLFLHWENLEAR